MSSFSPFMGIYAVGFFARLSYALARSPVLPLFALYFGAGPEAIGWVVGVSTVTGIFFKLPSGALSDIIGRKRTMLVGLFVFALMPFTYLLVTDVFLLVVIRFLHGFATAIYGPVSMAVIADLAGSKKGEMLSWFSSVTIIGNLLGAPIGGFVLYSMSKSTGLSLNDFQNVYLLSGCAGMISLICAWRYLKGQESIEKGIGLRGSLRKFASGIKEVVSDRRVVVTSSMEGLQNMTMGALEAFLPVYAVKVVGLNEFQAGLLWGIQVLVTILSKPIMGKLSDRYGRKPVIAAGMVLCAFSFACIPMLKAFYPLMITAAVFGLGEAFVTSSSAALVADICKDRHFGTAMGTFGTIFDIGHASGPIVAGILIARWGYLHTFVLMGSILLLALPVFILSVGIGKPGKIAYQPTLHRYLGYHREIQTLIGNRGALEAGLKQPAEGSAVPAEGYLRLFLRFLRFGLLAWGGPIAQIAMIRQELVEEEKWVSNDRFNRVLGVYQALPGPEAHELCVYFGMVAGGRFGGLLAGLGFMLPGFIFMYVLSWFYLAYGMSIPYFNPIFLGLQAAVGALIIRAIHRIGSHTLTNVHLWIIGCVAALAEVLGTPFVVTLVVLGAVYLLLQEKRPVLAYLVWGLFLGGVIFSWKFMGPGSVQAMSAAKEFTVKAGSLPELFVSGLRSGLLTFGGAYTVIAFLQHDAVEVQNWMTNAQFLDGLALSGTLPAPLIIFATFVGFVAGGSPGALIMTAGIFLPAFAFTLIGHNYLEKLIQSERLHAFLDGVTAAVVGLMAVTTLNLLRAGINNWRSLSIFGIALLGLYLLKSRLTIAFIMIAAGVAGVFLF